jgi:ABC-type multidrug transport system fused ATPase/permease subunit
LLDLQVRSAQQNLYAVTSGIGALFIGVIATSLNMLSDLAVFFVLTVGLALVNPAMAFGTFAFFGVIGLLMFGKLHRKAESLGRNYSQLTIKQNQILLEVLNSYREFLIRARRPFYVEKFRLVRNEIAKTESEINFMPSITKYVMETAVVVGAVIICAIEFLTQDASRAIATLTIFLAAGTRIAPALLRLQQAALNIRNSLGSSHVALDLLGILPPLEHNSEQTGDLDPIYYGFIADAKLKNVDFKYPNSESYAVRNLSLEIEQGSIVAIVGSSGAGKSTLVDLILGILSPENGEILLSGLRPKDAVQTWPGAIAYVPQDILIVEGTVKDNVALGYPESYATNEKVSKAIEIAQLSDFVSSLPNGIDANVGDRGNLLSGGQRQRLGIARALFTSPKFIVLDEATSALDGETEAKLADAINALRGNTTVVLIAHRLSTIRNADTVFYLKDGELIAKGTFEKVRELVPNFDQQASLMGL